MDVRLRTKNSRISQAQNNSYKKVQPAACRIPPANATVLILIISELSEVSEVSDFSFDTLRFTIWLTKTWKARKTRKTRNHRTYLFSQPVHYGTLHFAYFYAGRIVFWKILCQKLERCHLQTQTWSKCKTKLRMNFKRMIVSEG